VCTAECEVVKRCDDGCAEGKSEEWLIILGPGVFWGSGTVDQHEQPQLRPNRRSNAPVQWPNET
jgi:hypothetical protein